MRLLSHVLGRPTKTLVPYKLHQDESSTLDDEETDQKEDAGLSSGEEEDSLAYSEEYNGEETDCPDYCTSPDEKELLQGLSLLE
jgi:hypothetical protein